MRDHTYHVGTAEAGYGNPRNQSVSLVSVLEESLEKTRKSQHTRKSHKKAA